MLALCLAAIGASMFVAAAFAGSTASSKSEVSKGGTLRLNVSDTDYEYLDPALAYDSIGWATLYAVNQMLLNYPDKPASAGGNQLVPEAATGFPTVSKDGKTYVFTVKSGMKFSDGSPVTAAAFARSIYRVCHPDQGSPAVAFANNIAGCVAFNSKQGALTGVKAAGQKLTVKLITCRSDVPRADRDAVLRGREAEHADQPEGREHLPVGRPVSARVPRAGPLARAGAEQAVQGLASRRTRTAS